MHGMCTAVEDSNTCWQPMCELDFASAEDIHTPTHAETPPIPGMTSILNLCEKMRLDTELSRIQDWSYVRSPITV